MTEVMDGDEDEDGRTSLPSPLPSSQISSPICHTPTEISDLVSDSPSSHPTSDVHHNLLHPLAHCPVHPLFEIERLGVDRRLLVNRKRQLKMYRVWMQGNFRKLEL